MRTALIENYYESPEYVAKLRAKVKNMQEMESDEFLRQAKILDTYSTDPVKFIEDFCMIKFMENGGVTKPFFLFPYQKKIIHRIQEMELSNIEQDLLIDKPRGMGLTWVISAYFLWRFLFTPNYSVLILSRKEDLVDDGSDLPDSTIFGKIRFMMKRIPTYMLPEGFQHKKARGTVTDMNLKMINPTIGSSIIGSSTNSNAGRSGRHSTIFIDECFFIDNFQKIYNALTSVARLKIFVSTVVESRMAENFKNSCEKDGNYISLTYKDHPYKDDKWYEDLVKKSEEMDNPDLLREAKVDYRLSPRAQYYPQTAECKFEELTYDRNKPIWMGLDFGGQHDKTVLSWYQYDGRFKVLDAYENVNKPAEWYAPFMNPEVEYNPSFYNEFQIKMIEKVKSWKKPAAYFGELDHTVKKMPTNKSIADEMYRFGIRIIYNQYGITHPPRHEAVVRILPKTVFNQSADGAMRMFDALATSRYAQSARTTSEQLKPIHDDNISDYRAAFENFAVNTPRLFRSQREDIINEDEKSFARSITKYLRI